MITLVSGVNSIQLRDVTLRSYEYDFKVTYQRSMTGNLHTRKQTPAAIIHDVQVEFLSHAGLNEFRAFVLAAAGTSITYTDYVGTEWTVLLLDDPINADTTGSRGVIGSARIRLEGTYSG